MYDELVKRLRNRRICIQQSGSLDDFPLLKEAADAIEELSKPRWIPVTERLPGRDEYALFYASWVGASGTVYKEMRLASYSELEYQGYKPTHWMPLPEPPKEDTP